MQHRNIEQLRMIKFRVKLGDSAKETYDKSIKVFDNKTLDRAQMFFSVIKHSKTVVKASQMNAK